MGENIACRAGWSPFASAFGLLVFLAGCGQNQYNHPATTSLIDLLAETNRTKSTLVDYRELLAINGTLLAPELSTPVFYPYYFFGGDKRTNPAFLIGIPKKRREPTFRLSVESGPETKLAQVLAVRQAIEEVQAASIDAIAKARGHQIAVLQLAQAARDTPADVDAITKQTTARDTAKGELDTAETVLATAENKYRLAISEKPGIVVARWTTTSETATAGSLGSVFGGSTTEKETRQGYVILGGLRASMLVFGDDFRDYARSITDSSDRDMFKILGIPIYLLQARHVAYTNSLASQSSGELRIAVKLKELSDLQDLLVKIDEVKISSYRARAANLDNVGSFGNAKWSRVELPMVVYDEGSGKPALDIVRDRKLRKQLADAKKDDFDLAAVPFNSSEYPLPVSIKEDAGRDEMVKVGEPQWVTVYEVTATAPELYKAWSKTKEQYPSVVNVGGQWYSIRPRHEWDNPASK